MTDKRRGVARGPTNVLTTRLDMMLAHDRLLALNASALFRGSTIR